MIKVLLFTLEYPPFKGGVAKYYSDIVQCWPEQDNVFVLHNNEGQLISKFGWPKWLKAVMALYREVKKKKIDHVLVGHILPLGTVAWLLSKILNFKYSVFIHGLDINFSQRSSRKRLITKIILNNATNIICNSSYGADIIGKILPKSKDKIKIVHPAVEYPNPESSPTVALAEAGPIPNPSITNKYNLKNKYIIFSIGRLVKRKGFDMMIKAMSKIIEKTPNVSYIIAGTGPDEEYLKNLAESRGRNSSSPEMERGATAGLGGTEFLPRLEKDGWSRGKPSTSSGQAGVPSSTKKVVRSSNNIKFIGKISDEEKWAWLRACDIFAMPCRDIDGDAEGFGIVFLEANLAGKPVIAGRSGGVADAVIDYETGILVDPESVEDIAEGAIELLSKPQLRIQLGEKGMRRVLEDFAVKDKVGELCRIVNMTS